MKHFLTLLILFSSLLKAEISTPEDISNLTAEPNTLIGGYINVITGDFVLRKSDLSIKGAIPLECHRYLTSRDKLNQEDKWELYATHRAKRWGDHLEIQEENGVWIPYHKTDKWTWVPNKTFFENRPSLRLKHNPRENRAIMHHDSLVVTRSDGTQRVFRRWHKDDPISDFILEKEILQTGHVKKYIWETYKNVLIHAKTQHLKSVQITSPSEDNIFASVDYKHSLLSIKGKGSNGKFFEFETDTIWKDEMGQIRHVNSSDHPRESYRWKDKKLIKYILPDERKVHLEYKGHRVSKLILPEGLTYELEYYNGWTNVTNPDRSKATYYHSNYRIDKVDYYGHQSSPVKTEHYTWSSSGLLLKKTILDADQKTLLTADYTYDDRNNLICQKTTGAITHLTSTTLTTHYLYDHLHRRIHEETPSGHIIETRYLQDTHLPEEILETHNGNTLSRIHYTYNSNNLLIAKETDTGEHSPVRQTEVIQRSASDRTLGLPTQIEIFINGELTSKQSYTYNDHLDITSCSTFNANGDYCYSTSHTYNDKGLLTKSVDPFNQETSYTYNDNRECISETNATDLETKRHYDKLGRLLKEEQIGTSETRTTTYTYYTSHQPTSITDPDGNQTLFRYDPFGNLIRTTLPSKGNIITTYNVLNHLISQRDPLGNTTTFVPNIFGQPLAITHPDKITEWTTYTVEGKPSTHTDRSGTQTRTTYDDYGNPIHTKLYCPLGILLAESTKRYDTYRLLEETDPEGHTTNYSYNTRNQIASLTRAGHTTTYTYDASGRRNSETRGSLTYRQRFDNFGRPIQEETLENGSQVTFTQTSYTPVGNPRTIVRYPNNQAAMTTIAYDQFDRPVKKTDPMGNVSTFTYGHNTITTHYPGGITTIETQEPTLHTYQKYDNYNHLLEEKTLTFDKAGNLLTEKSGNYIVSYAYNSMGLKKSQLESNTRQTHYTYTPQGQLATLQKPDGTTLTYTYDSLGHLSHLTSSAGDIDYYYIHNKLGHLLKSTDTLTGTSTNRSPDPFGNTLEEIQASGHTISYTYDSAHRRSSCTLPDGQTLHYTHTGHLTESISTSTHTHTFNYDLAGNPTSETNFASLTTSRSYDPLNRPTTLSSPYINQACSYNNRGNLTSTLLDHTSKNFVHDQQDRVIKEPDHTYQYDQLHNRTSHNNIPVTYNTLNENTAYTYDPNGNLLSDGDNNYTYDSLNRLIGLNNQTYTYDAQHRRTDLLWDHDREIGTLDELRILDPNHPSDYAIAIISNQLLLPVHDIHHNLLKVFTLDGTLIESRTLTSFGESSPSSIPWSFCGKRITQHLLYFDARYYSPSDGRFLTPDPAGYTDSLNLYAYALNNPLRYFDPDGLMPDDYAMTKEPKYEPLYNPSYDPAANPNYISYENNSIWRRYASPEAQQKWEYSRTSDLKLPELPDRRILFINGVGNSFEEFQDHQNYLSKFTGGRNIHGVYNASNGKPADFQQAYISILRGYTDPERVLVSSIRDYFAKACREASLLLVAHSHGAAVARNALEILRNESFKSRIYVIAIAPAAYTDPKSCAFVRHYVHPNDIVHYRDWVGAALFRHTIQKVGRFRLFPFKSHHSFQDEVYQYALYQNISEYSATGVIKE